MSIYDKGYENIGRGQENLPSLANKPISPGHQTDQTIKTVAGKNLPGFTPEATLQNHDIVQLHTASTIDLAVVAKKIGIDVSTLKQKYVQDGKLDVDKLVTDHQQKIENLASFQTTYQKIAAKFEMEGGQLVTKKMPSMEYVDEKRLVEITDTPIATGINQTTLKKALAVALIHFMAGEVHSEHTLEGGGSIQINMPDKPGKTAVKVSMTFGESVKIGTHTRNAAIGAGAFGEVRLAMNFNRGELQVQKTAKEGAGEELKKEYQLLSELNPNNDVVGIQKKPRQLTNLSTGAMSHLVPLYTCDASQLTENKSIFSNIPLKSRENYAKQLLEGLAYLHDKKVQHGDLKVHNILVGYDEDKQENVMHIADFGGARRFDEAFTKNPTAPSAATFMMTREDYSKMITTDPTTPEGQRREYARDVFAMGAILYEILTGEPPYMAREESPKDHRLAPPQDEWIEEAAKKLEGLGLSEGIAELVIDMLSEDPMVIRNAKTKEVVDTIFRPTAREAFTRLKAAIEQG